MPNHPSDHNSCDKPDCPPTISVDSYGIKTELQLEPGEGGERPENWKEVRRRCSIHIMRVCVDSVGFIADSMGFLRRLINSADQTIKGLSRIPGALAERIGRAHDRADVEEAKRQQQREIRAEQKLLVPALTTAAASLPAPKHSGNVLDDPARCAAAKLRDKLEELRAKGIRAEIFRTKEGSIIVLAVPPDEEIIAFALKRCLEVIRDFSPDDDLESTDDEAQHPGS